MKKFLSACVILMSFSFALYAQEDESKSTKVTVHHDDDMNRMVYGNEGAKKEATPVPSQATSTPKAKPSGTKRTSTATKQQSKQTNNQSETTGTTRAKRTGTNATTVAKTTKPKPGNKNTEYKYSDGFRIQVVSRGNTRRDHDEVTKIAKNFSENYFRDWRVDVRFKSPRWICLAGDFRSRKQAQSALKRIQHTHKFTSATIVRAKIRYAKQKPSTASNTGSK